MSHERWSIPRVDCNKNPIPHVWSSTLVRRDVYDKLYEQWNNIEHPHWTNFVYEMCIEVYFHNDFTHMLTPKKSNEYIGYWFFQQRTDKSKGGEIELTDGTNKKTLSYWHNTMLILETDKSFAVLPRKHELPQRPFCELYFDSVTNEKIKRLLS
jgi:hypothetical protein